MVIRMDIGMGMGINVDPVTVDSVASGEKGETHLNIGPVVLKVKGRPSEIAAQISKARGHKCPLVKPARAQEKAPGVPAEEDDGEGGGVGHEGSDGGEGPGLPTDGNPPPPTE